MFKIVSSLSNSFILIKKQNISKSVKRRNQKLRKKLKKQLSKKPIFRKKNQKLIHQKYQSKYSLLLYISKHYKSQKLFFKYTKKLKYRKKLIQVSFKPNLKYKKSFLKKSNKFNQFKFLLKKSLYFKSNFFPKSNILKSYFFFLKYKKLVMKTTKNRFNNFLFSNNQLQLRKFFLSYWNIQRNSIKFFNVNLLSTKLFFDKIFQNNNQINKHDKFINLMLLSNNKLFLKKKLKILKKNKFSTKNKKYRKNYIFKIKNKLYKKKIIHKVQKLVRPNILKIKKS